MKKLALALLAVILVGCGSQVKITETAIFTSEPTQTPHVVVVTATPELLQTVVPTPQNTVEPTESCPPRVFSRISVGYVPGLDIGDKKSPVVVNIGCGAINIQFANARISGVLSPDGLTVLDCVFYGDGKEFPCELRIPVQSADNPFIQANGWIFKKANKELVCLAETSQSYAAVCE